MLLVILTYKKPRDIVDQHVEAHRNFLDQGYKKDYFIVSGPKNPRDGGIILSQLDDREQLLTILKQDPFYIHGIADFEIIEFAPVKYHPDFANFVS
jgi:uncharacterized protein YciI